MRAVIDGKRYDTDKADLVAEYSNGDDTSNFGYFREGLYRTPRGTWFLAGTGHGNSPYAEHFGDSRGWGSAIRPLSAEEAMEWLEGRNEVDALETYFGEQIEDA